MRKMIDTTKALANLVNTIRKGRLTENSEEMLKKILEIFVEEFGLSLAWIGKKEQDGSVSIFSVYPLQHPYPREINVRWDDSELGRGPTGKAIRLSKYQVVEDIEMEEYKPWEPFGKKYGFRCSAAFPIIISNDVFGAINLYSRKKGFFTFNTCEILQSFTDLIAMVLEKTFLIERANRRLKWMETLRGIDVAILSSMDMKVISDVLIYNLFSNMNVEGMSLLFFDDDVLELYSYSIYGLPEELKTVRIKLGKFIPGRVAREKHIYVITNKEMDEPVRKIVMEATGLNFYAGLPLVSKGKLLGILELFKREPFNHTKEWLDYFETLAGQISIGIESVKAFSELENKSAELSLAYDQTIEAISSALDLRDKETEGHSQRVTELTVKIAEKMGMKGEKLKYVKWGALLHDIGKLGVPDSILHKPGPLTEEEWKIMKRHPELGYQMLSRIDFILPALEIPLYHHEKWDGSGYPKGLKGKEIPLPARIFAVVDVYDALTNDRPYRKAYRKEEAVEEILRQSGKHFDPEVVRVFVEWFV
jgi:putative nucleotidyltransferase with HDIG domain